MERIDRLLVKLNKADTRSKAKALILSGNVYVNDTRVEKAGVMVKEDVRVEVKHSGDKYVSRGGYKLEAALKYFDISPEGLTALDAGASTGGFTDCLLQNGTREVIAVDVGYGQLDYMLQKDPRVTPLFRKNVRYLTFEDIGKPLDIITLDLSFISLRKVLQPLKELLEDKGRILALVKPQFEAGRDFVQKGGVVKDPAVHKKVLIDVMQFSENIDLCVQGCISSPLLGPKGNREFFLLLEKNEDNQPSKQDLEGKMEKLLIGILE